MLQDLLYGLSRDCSCFSGIKRQSHLVDGKMQICVGCPFHAPPPEAHGWDSAFTAEGLGFIPGQGTKIPHDFRMARKKSSTS